MSDVAPWLMTNEQRLQWRKAGLKWVVPGFAGKNAVFVQSFNRICEEIFDMAAKRTKTTAKAKASKTEFVWKGFVDVKLSDQDKGNYAAWDIEDDAVWDGIASYCEAGIKIALTYNASNASFTCSGTGQAASGNNNGWCVNAYAKSPYEAARVWLFKVSVILPPDWEDYDAGDADSIG